MGAGGAGRDLGSEDAGLNWHPECLSPAQREVLGQLGPPLSEEGFYLAGGTAVALHLGHRLSVDLDFLGPFEDWPEGPSPVASLDDLSAMKLSAIAQRGSRKDFVDLWALGTRHVRLPGMLELYRRKYDVPEMAHLLYSLSFFDDADEEPMPRMLEDAEWEWIKTTIREWLGECSGGGIPHPE